MTAAVSETVSEVEVLRHQAVLVQKVIEANLAGLTQEDSLVQPPTGGNCLNWVMGHLLNIYNLMLPMLGQERVMPQEALKRYDRGAPPLQDPAEALDLQDILTAWNEVNRRFDTGLASLTPEALDRPAPDSPDNDPNETVRSLLSTVVFHQAYHAGQTGVLRRIAGKEGAIK